MSQIGKKPISIPKGVQVDNKDNILTVKGELGTLVDSFEPSIKINIKEEIINISRPNNLRKNRELHGLTRALINNMVIGVSEGYKKELHLVGTGYTADSSKGNFLLLNIGYSHPIYVQCPDNLIIETPKPTIIIIKGINKQFVGQYAAKIRDLRKPEPYKGKGIRYSDEYVRRKAGKTVGAVGA